MALGLCGNSWIPALKKTLTRKTLSIKKFMRRLIKAGVEDNPFAAREGRLKGLGERVQNARLRRSTSTKTQGAGTLVISN
jgi:hypothetical protein